MADDKRTKPQPIQATAVLDLNEYSRRQGELQIANADLLREKEQLSKDNAQLHRDLTKYSEHNAKLAKLVERYKACVEFYGAEQNWHSKPVQSEGRFYYVLELGPGVARRVLGKD